MYVYKDHIELVFLYKSIILQNSEIEWIDFSVSVNIAGHKHVWPLYTES